MCFYLNGGIKKCDYYYKKYVFFNFVKIGLIRDVEFRIIFEKVRIEDKGIRWI